MKDTSEWRPESSSNLVLAITSKIIEQLEQGTAPWIKPWKPGEFSSPFNPISGTKYRGVNFVQLASAGFSDPRWTTYNQARSAGWQVKKGERGTKIVFWKFDREVAKLDAEGREVKDEDGKVVKEKVRLDQPQVFAAVVFNAAQMLGVPPLEPVKQRWAPLEKAEQILQSSGASICHDQRDAAFYSPRSDSIHLPNKAQFASVEGYYATALHELAHWTGHESRLNRDIYHPFLSEGYAREELRAEIASMMLGDELEIGHDPGKHAAYVSSWISILRDDPFELHRAAKDAEIITRYVSSLGLEMNQKNVLDSPKDEIKVSQKVHVAGSFESPTPDSPDGKVYLMIPYEEKEEAKRISKENGISLGWDPEAKSWWAKGEDLSSLNKWATARISADPVQQFGEALREAGLVLDGQPKMDGKLHRTSAEGGKRGNKDGAYVGYLDGGLPSGFIQNFRTGEKRTWSARGVNISPAQMERLQQQAQIQRAQRDKEISRRQEHISSRVTELYRRLPNATSANGYLGRKSVTKVFPGMKEDRKGRLVIPLQDVDGKIWSLQRIGANGFKALKKGGRKTGLFFVLNSEQLQNGKPILIAEGVATAASLAMATGRAVVVAFDAGNLSAVAQALKARYPTSPYYLMGDNDAVQKVNSRLVSVGREQAQKAAELVGGKAIFPVFSERSNNSDWNDLHVTQGLGAVTRQVESILSVQQSNTIAYQSPQKEKVVRMGRR